MTPIFDYDASLARMGFDETLLQEMAALLMKDGPARLRDALAALNKRDAWSVQHAAHTLKGLAANFGAERVMAAATRLEELARREKWSEMSAATAVLQQTLAELLLELRPFAAGASEPV